MSDHLRILVVDDHPPARTILCELLNTVGYEVETAKDGLEGVDVFESGTFDLVITDFHMPRANGGHLIWHVYKSSNPVPVVLCTANTQCLGELQIDTIAAVVQKPFSPGSILNLISSILES